jgi:hypothetical protein
MEVLFEIGALAGLVAILAGVWVFLQTNLYLTLLRWLWSAILLVLGVYTGWRTIESMDFGAPVLHSFHWATVGYLLLTVLLWTFAWKVFRMDVKFED